MLELSHAISISKEIAEKYCSIEQKLNRITEIIELEKNVAEKNSNKNGNGNGNRHK